MDKTEKIWLNGKLVDWEDAKVHVLAHALNYGTGVFEGIRVYHTPDDHCSCRKPEVGMGLAAITQHSINPRISFMVGDHEKDMEFGRRLGFRCIQVSESFTFSDAVDEILRSP